MNTSYLKRELIDITKCLHLSEDFINSFALNNHSRVKIAYLMFAQWYIYDYIYLYSVCIYI